MTWRVFDSTLTVATTLLVAAALGSILLRGVVIHPPVDIRSVEALNSPLRSGEILRVRIDRIKSDSCPVTSFREVIDVDGRNVRLETSEMQPGGPVDRDFVVVTYSLPELSSGQYWLRVHLVYHCPDRLYPVRQPDVPFRVVD